MSRALLNPGDDTHYGRATLPALAAFRVEMRIRNLVVATGGDRALVGTPAGYLRFQDNLTQIRFVSFRAGDTADMQLGTSDPVWTNVLPLYYECYVRFQFDPVARRFSLELWDLVGGNYRVGTITNGVSGNAVTAAAFDAGVWSVGSLGVSRLGGDIDFCRIFNTNVALGSQKPVDTVPASSSVHAAWEFEDSLADVTGTYPLVWQGGGAPAYGDTAEAPSVAPTLSSATYSTNPDLVTLAFTAPNTGGQTAAWVDVERRLGTTGDWLRLGFTTNAGATSYVDHQIKHAKGYEYRVKARNRLGASAYSNVVTVTTGAGVDTNPTIAENAKTGAGAGALGLTNPASAREIEGYCDLTSYQRGETVNIKVNSAGAAAFDLDVYRVGWYGGDGARLIRHVAGIAGTVQTMPTETNPSVNRYDFECNWSTSYALALTDADPTEWPSGIYLGRLTQAGTGKQAYVVFCIRDESRQSELYYNQPVNTYQAYNHWPNTVQDGGSYAAQGRSFYINLSAALSFNRPYMVPASPNSNFGLGAGSLFAHLLNAPSRVNQLSDEINWIRWFEKNGYDIQYGTDVDFTNLGEKIWARCFGMVFPGHQEYTTLAEQTGVVAARDYGRHLAFICANGFYWPVRYEAGPVSGEPQRTLIGYKNLPGDPYAVDPVPAELVRQNTFGVWSLLGTNPVDEETFIGVGYDAGDFGNDPFVPTVAGAAHAVMAGTGITAGESIAGLVGYEFDIYRGLCPFAPTVLTDVAAEASGRHANSTIYTHPSGAVVYAAGSMQFGWALDDFGAPAHRASRLNAKVEAMMTNVMTLERTPTVAEAGSEGPPPDGPGPLTYAPIVL